MPEDQAGPGDLLNAEQIKLLAEHTVVAVETETGAASNRVGVDVIGHWGSGGGDLRAFAISQLGLLAANFLLVNLWEETAWAGFLQTRLEPRYHFAVAAALTAVPFAGVHLPLLFIDDDLSALSLLRNAGGLLILGVLVRLMIGVVLHGAADSLLAVGVLHAVFNSSNNQGGLVDSLLDGTDQTVVALAATVLVTAAAAWAIRERLTSTPQRQPERVRA